MIDKTLTGEISKALCKEPGILAAYVLGSFKKGTANKESDFDLCVVVDNKVKLSDKSVYLLLHDINFPKNLDLSVVDKLSSPLFLFQVISTGDCIYQRSKEEKVQFEAFVMTNYYDTAHLRRIYESHLKDKFA